MRNEKLYALKQLLKSEATELRLLKIEHKETQRSSGGSGIEITLHQAQRSYRHKHIAYCLLRGREYGQIEHPAKGNEPDWNLIREVQNEYTTSSDVCACQIGS